MKKIAVLCGILLFFLSMTGCTVSSPFQNEEGTAVSSPTQNSYPSAYSSRLPRDEVWYMIFTDRFSDGNSSNNPSAWTNTGNLYYYAGGDWAGIRNKAAYLTNLGVSTIWISPIIDQVAGGAGALFTPTGGTQYITGYHGYWGRDWNKLNPIFGTSSEFSSMISTMHSNNVKVVVDTVLNHTGPGDAGTAGMGYTPDQTSIYNNGVKTYQFAWTDGVYNNASYPFNTVAAQPGGMAAQTWKEVGELMCLRDINQYHSGVWNYLLAAHKSQINTYGFDGFRVDTVSYFASAKWSDFVSQIMSTATTKGLSWFNIMGEVYKGATTGEIDYIAGWHNTANNINSRASCFNFARMFALDEAFGNSALTLSNLHTLHYYENSKYNNIYNMVVFLDNHDVSRFITYWNDLSGAKEKVALAYLFGQASIPGIYYGTEQLIPGSADPDNRRPMWNYGNFQTTSTFYTYVKKLIQIRKNLDVLRRGGLETDCYFANGNQWAFYRTYGTDVATVILNKATSSAAITLTYPAAYTGTLVDQITGSTKGTLSGGKVTITIPAQSGMICTGVVTNGAVSTTTTTTAGTTTTTAAGTTTTTVSSGKLMSGVKVQSDIDGNAMRSMTYNSSTGYWTYSYAISTAKGYYVQFQDTNTNSMWRDTTYNTYTLPQTNRIVYKNAGQVVHFNAKAGTLTVQFRDCSPSASSTTINLRQ